MNVFKLLPKLIAWVACALFFCTSALGQSSQDSAHTKALALKIDSIVHYVNNKNEVKANTPLSEAIDTDLNKLILYIKQHNDTLVADIYTAQIYELEYQLRHQKASSLSEDNMQTMDSIIYYLKAYNDKEIIAINKSLINDVGNMNLYLQKHKNKSMISKYPAITEELDSLSILDQKYRQMLIDTASKYGYQSSNVLQIALLMQSQDVKNISKVETIIDKYGWLGPNDIGENETGTLFIVIQHADLKTQEKYLPVILQATKDEKASLEDLTLLVDRVESHNGRLQIYGTQAGFENNKIVLSPIYDAASVDKRRYEAGLPPLNVYIKLMAVVYKTVNK